MMIRVLSAVSLAALLLAAPAAFAEGDPDFQGPHYVVSGETRLAVAPFAGEGDAPVYTDYLRAPGFIATDVDALHAAMRAAGGS